MMEQPWNQNFKHAHVKYALRWLFNALDPDVRNQELQITPQVYPPGPSKNQCSTILCSERPHPVFIIPDPTPEERAKAKAIHATKRAMKHTREVYLSLKTPGGPLTKHSFSMAVRHPAKPKRRHIGWNSHSRELYTDSSDVHPDHCRHHHQSWSFPGPLGGTSLVKLGFVNLPVSPQKKMTIFSPDYDDLSPLPPHFLNTSSVNDTSHEQYHLDPEAYALAMASDMENIVTAPHRRIYSYNPLLTFSSYIDDYLAESMQQEGRRDTILQKHCPSCRSTQISLRCITCRDVRLFCPVCMVALHAACLTHIIQHWNGAYFEKVRHIIGEVCPHPRPAFGDHFMIIDTNGIHNVTLNFCNCIHERPLASQLQHAWLFPTTGREPHTAVTTAALEQFQMLTFMGKISTYEYYYSLVRLTDNTNTKTPSLKRAGISNDPGGWKNAKLASCAVECLACLQPGINIPKVINPNDPDAWLYTLYLGMDGNFCLERFDVSSEDKDPGLGGGLAYCVDTTIFHQHLQDFDKCIIQPSSTCSNHEAMKGDNRMRNWTQDLAASGVGGVVCTQHELKLPLSMVDLRVGETQVKMDFGYLSAIKCFDGIPWVVTSYNIACQWSINLDKCIEIYGDHMRPQIPNSLYLVPKFHLPGHIEECQEKYCMSFHTKFTKSLPQQDVAKWTEIVEAWEADRTKLNPFARTVANKTEAAMHLQLAQEDAQDELAGLDSDEFHTTSPKDMILQGIQLEGSQRRIAWLNKDLGLHSTDLQRAQVLEKSNHLCRHIESWFIIQEVHMPMAYKDSDTNVLTQKKWLKCHKITQDLNTRITQAKQYYRDVRKRLLVLSEVLGERSWQAQLCILEDSDVIGRCHGYGILHILGTCPAVSKNVCVLNGARHVHEPTNGEKNQTLDYEADLWLSRASSTSMGGSLIQAGEGAAAYAKCQASIRKSICELFEKKWLYANQYIALGETDESPSPILSEIRSVMIFQFMPALVAHRLIWTGYTRWRSAISAIEIIVLDVAAPESAVWEEWGLGPEGYLTRRDPVSHGAILSQFLDLSVAVGWYGALMMRAGAIRVAAPGEERHNDFGTSFVREMGEGGRGGVVVVAHFGDTLRSRFLRRGSVGMADTGVVAVTSLSESRSASSAVSSRHPIKRIYYRLHQVILLLGIRIASVYGREMLIEELVVAEMMRRIPDEGVLGPETRYPYDGGFIYSLSLGRNAVHISDRKPEEEIRCSGGRLYSKREVILVEEFMVLQ
ncbi:hypothetical protein EDD18DRAFT_1109479 [Armillaria luteobubalina]|uniref:CxC2-like cysteine cluster KDZ transposase-associated domain-containing protein n=1 Tax=Armillaria luteobubalina TaxID=153913 RepID=A0AA39UKK1_9AGAR|nr:hypothetical protein EDD18DRAFT_1109479 [Armillaria luteobubalina]